MGRRAFRGQATTEFALVLPVMVVILLYSMVFTERVRAKLKLQEASRFLAWEMTSHPLDDFGSGNHDKAFLLAQRASVRDAVDKYKDLESIDNKAAGNFVVGYSNLTARVTAHDAPSLTHPIAPISGNLFVNNLLAVLTGPVGAAYQHFGFNLKGKVQVEVSVQLDNRLLPRRFLDENGGFFRVDVWGGRNLQNATIKNRFTLVASGWDLPDGADGEQHQRGPGAARSGVHRGGSDHGLYLQVARMSLLGARHNLGRIPGFTQLARLIGDFVPNPVDATYVVSHNYFAPGDRGIKGRGCEAFARHGAHWGQNNLGTDASNDGPDIDHPGRRCFDTAPFRDTSNYDDSQYRAVFQARGRYFMGCKRAEADNPAEAGAPAHSDKDQHNKKYSCEDP